MMEDTKLDSVTLSTKPSEDSVLDESSTQNEESCDSEESRLDNSFQHLQIDQLRFINKPQDNMNQQPILVLENNAGKINTDDCKNVANLDYGRLVLHNSGGTYYAKLMSSCNRSKVPFEVETHKLIYPRQWQFTIKVNYIEVSSVCNSVKKVAREAASKEAWEKLNEKVEMVDRRIKSKTCSVEKKTMDNLINGLETKVESAVAVRMMKLMGWKGGPLGREGNGITEPVPINITQAGRAGLGSEAVRKYMRSKNIKENRSEGDEEYKRIINRSLYKLINSKPQPNNLSVSIPSRDVNSNEIPKRDADCNNFVDSEYGKLVLYDCDALPLKKLRWSCRKYNIPFKVLQSNEDAGFRCTVFVNNIEVSSACETTKKVAKKVASKTAWEILKSKLPVEVYKSLKTIKRIRVQDVGSSDKTKDNSDVDKNENKLQQIPKDSNIHKVHNANLADSFNSETKDNSVQDVPDINKLKLQKIPNESNLNKVHNVNLTDESSNKMKDYLVQDILDTYEVKLEQIPNDSNINKVHNRILASCNDIDSISSSECGPLVLFDKGEGYIRNLVSSCKRCKIPFKSECKYERPHYRCTIYINHIAMCVAYKMSKKTAKEIAGKLAWEMLQSKLYTLVQKRKHVSQNWTPISVQDIVAKANPNSAATERMSQLMADTLNSVTELLNLIKGTNFQSQFGNDFHTEVGIEDSSFRDVIASTVREFAQSDSLESDLVFAPDFTRDQRALIHTLAESLGLKSKSYGKSKNRYIVVKKPLCVKRVLESLIQDGGSNENYDLKRPTNRLLKYF